MTHRVRLFARIVVMAVFLSTPCVLLAEPSNEDVGADASTGEAAEADQADAQEQEDADYQGLEEITVTATKRAESLQDVPLSIAALSEQTIKDTGLTQFNQIQQFVPNLKIIPVADTRSTSIRIRGIGSVGTNAGIDPSVGVFIDGVYQGRAGMSVADLLDVERIEVLRGPQGTLFGKNTAAGAITITTKRPSYDITITTKRPSYDWETFLETVVGNYNTLEFRGSLNIPIVEDRLAARISGYKALRDGFDTNRFDGSNVNDNNKYGIRGKIAWDITDELTLMISGDFSEQNDTCCVADIITYEGESQLGTNFDRLSRAAYADDRSDRFEPTEYFPVVKEIPDPPDPFDRIVGADSTPKNVVNVGGVAADLLWEHEEHMLHWLTAYRIYTSDSQFDGDFSTYDAVLTWVDVDFEQVSSELTWTSPTWDKVEAQGGLYLYYSTMNTVDLLGMQPYYLDRNFLMKFGEDAVGIPQDGVYNTNDNTHRMFSVAPYAQGTYRFTDWLALTGGLRVTHEKKWRELISTSTWDSPQAAPPVGGADIELDQSRQVTNLQWHVALRYFPVDDVTLYAKVGNGFKSGGFNQVRVNNLPSEFDDEEALAFELGAKTQWFDNRLTVNLTGFFTDYDDFQAQLFTGTTINVRNAATLYSYGFESEITAMPVEGLLLGFNVGFTIAEYQSFPGAENTIANESEIMAAAKEEQGYPPSNPTPIAFWCGKETVDCTQDLSGRVLDGAPRWTTAAFMGYERPLPWFPVLWFTRADWSFTSEYYMAQDLDPNLLQEPFHLLNLRTGLRADNNLWELTFWMNNVTDTEWMVVGFDVPTVGGFAAINGPPRQYGGTVRINF